MRYVVWFLGGPTDRWHQWAMRHTLAEVLDVEDLLLQVKGVWAVSGTVIGEQPVDPKDLT